MDDRLLGFINNDKKKHKDATPNLGVLLVYILCSQKI